MATPPTGNPEGRPSLYSPDMPDRLKSYMEHYEEQGDELPMKSGFADFIGVCDNTLDNWGKKFPEFLSMLQRLKTKQHRCLINKGLNGGYSSVIAKLLLCSDHNHVERNDTTSGGEKIQPQSVDFMNLLDQLKAKKAEKVQE